MSDIQAVALREIGGLRARLVAFKQAIPAGDPAREAKLAWADEQLGAADRAQAAALRAASEEAAALVEAASRSLQETEQAGRPIFVVPDIGDAGADGPSGPVAGASAIGSRALATAAVAGAAAAGAAKLAGAPAGQAAGAAVGAAVGAVAMAFRPSAATTFPALEPEYADFYRRCAPHPHKAAQVNAMCGRITAGRDRYEAASRATGGRIPWHFIGICHALESGCDFGRHLHNGDPLEARTTRVPKGRPEVWPPPPGEDPWAWSAADALRLKGLHQEEDWSVPRMLWHWERFNGLGYRKFGIPTPYLWSCSQIYTKGKYVRDHVFDPEAVSGQVGAAVLLKALSP